MKGGVGCGGFVEGRAWGWGDGGMDVVEQMGDRILMNKTSSTFSLSCFSWWYRQQPLISKPSPPSPLRSGQHRDNAFMRRCRLHEGRGRGRKRSGLIFTLTSYILYPVHRPRYYLFLPFLIIYVISSHILFQSHTTNQLHIRLRKSHLTP